MSESITEALVLRVTPFRETDQIVQFFTKDFGKVSGLARHAFKSKRRFGTQLNIFHPLKIRFKRKPGRDLVMLEEVRASLDLSGIYQDWRRISLACFMTDCVSEMTREDSVNPSVYEAIWAALQSLATQGDWNNILLLFLHDLLESSGYRPIVAHCVTCKCEWRADEIIYWVHGAGGAHCRRCLPQGLPYERVSPELRQCLEFAEPGFVPVSLALPAAQLLYTFMRYQLGHSIRSWDFLEQMGLLTEFRLQA